MAKTKIDKSQTAAANILTTNMVVMNAIRNYRAMQDAIVSKAEKLSKPIKEMNEFGDSLKAVVVGLIGDSDPRATVMSEDGQAVLEVSHGTTKYTTKNMTVEQKTKLVELIGEDLTISSKAVKDLERSGLAPELVETLEANKDVGAPKVALYSGIGYVKATMEKINYVAMSGEPVERVITYATKKFAGVLAEFLSKVEDVNVRGALIDNLNTELEKAIKGEGN
jgi:hypothetical protein